MAPKVSIVVAARDEAPHIEAAVATMLAQDYPDLELVVVDDRSTDGTGPILDRMATADRRLAVVHVTGLPTGWLGKNHALQVGAARAVGRCQAAGLDHLAVAPDLIMPGPLLEASGSSSSIPSSRLPCPGKPPTRRAGSSSGSGPSI